MCTVCFKQHNFYT